MKAFGYSKSGPASVIEAFDAPVPVPGARDLRVAVRAISVNPVDTKVRANVSPEDGQRTILGWDAAGVVDAIGSEVSLFKVGDEVAYSGVFTRPGANAEFSLVDERIVGPKPKTLSFAEAAALPLTTITAWEVLFERLRIPCGTKLQEGALLVIGGAGGVGSILIQLARRLTGLTIVATASRPESAEWARSMGAHHVVDHRKPLDEEMKAIGIPEVEYVASLVSTDKRLPALVNLIAPRGTIAVTDDPVTLDIAPFKPKCVSFSWEFMFVRPMYDTPDVLRIHELLAETAFLVDAGVLRTTLTNVLGPITAENLRAAHVQIESGRTIGKTVLEGF